jgi:phosphomannomutase
MYELVADLLKNYGLAMYRRVDIRLKRPVAKTLITRRMMEGAPKRIGGELVVEVQDTDGVKYILEDDSWLLIRPSGTEPVLRVYAEGQSDEIVEKLIGYGETVAASVT